MDEDELKPSTLQWIILTIQALIHLRLLTLWIYKPHTWITWLTLMIANTFMAWIVIREKED